MRYRGISETALVDELLRNLERRLPPGWTVSGLRESRTSGRQSGRWRPDALLRITAPDGTTSEILVEAKSKIDPKDVPSAVAQARAYRSEPILVAAPYLSPRTRERLVEWGVGYGDSTGNLRIVIDRPSMFIEAVGAQESPWTESRPLRSLKGPAAGRVVRALCDFKPPYGIRELGERAGISASTVARVVEVLDREAILQREPRGRVLTVDWKALVRRWVQDYSLTDSNRTANFLEPRGLSALVERFRGGADYCLTGSLAASVVAPVAPARLAVIYVRSIRDTAELLTLRPTEAGANVLLAEPFDRVVFDRTWQREELTYAAISQVAADLLTSPGRGPAEAEELIDWMSRNEDGWRS